MPGKDVSFPVSSLQNAQPAGSDGISSSSRVIEDRYEVFELVGTGGWGEVYRARQMNLQRDVAVKFLHRQFSVDDDKVRRFQLEVEAISRLRHTNITSVFDYGTADGQPYIVMEFLQGESLQSLLAREERLSWRDWLPLMQQICEALQAAHTTGIIHRDIKPSNIILVETNGRRLVKLVDFGTAKLVSGTVDDPPVEPNVNRGTKARNTLTVTGELFGTPMYMSPEQCLSSALDGRTDMYSLGCVAYEALVGTTPFAKGSAFDCMERHVSSLPNAFPVHAVVPTRVQEMIFRCLAKKPEDRFANMHELSSTISELIETAEDGGFGVIRNGVVVQDVKAARRPRSEKWLMPVVVVSLLYLLAVPGLWFLFNNQKTPVRKPVAVPVSTAKPVKKAAKPVNVNPNVGTSDQGSLQPYQYNWQMFYEGASRKSDNERPELLFKNIVAATEKAARELPDGLAILKSISEIVRETSGAYNYRSEKPEVHAVGIRWGKPVSEVDQRGQAKVIVNYSGAPIVLVLASGGAKGTLWDLKVAPNAHLQKIVLMGNSRENSKISGLPVGTPVIQAPSNVYSWAADRDQMMFPEFAKAQRKLTGMEMTTFLPDVVGLDPKLDMNYSSGSDKCGNQVYVVGPTNSDWRYQHLLYRMQPLFKQATKDALAVTLNRLKKLHAPFVFYTSSPNDVGEPFQHDLVRKTATVDGTGKVSAVGFTLPLDYRFICPANAKGQLFAPESGGITLLGSKGEKIREWLSPEDIGSAAAESQLAWNSDKNRLYVQAGGNLQELDIVQNKWRTLGLSFGPEAFTYSEKDKCIYAVPTPANNNDSINVLFKFAADGKYLGTINLSQPIPMQRMGEIPEQLLVLGDYLMLLNSPQMEAGGLSGAPFWVVDPHSGSIIYQGETHQ